jgi:paraquat-inducible protein A
LAHTPRDFSTSGWIACPECDLVQRDPQALRRHTVLCARCDATLHHGGQHALDITLSAMVAAAVLFALANAFPFMSLELQGRTTSQTLFGMTQALQQAGMTSVAALVFVTLIAMPALELAAFIYLLAPLKLGIVPIAAGPVARLLNAAKPWSMVEIFMLGALVSIGKLEDFAALELEPGFWCAGAVMMLFALAETVFDQRALWECAAQAGVPRQ